ncbi:hypothetical protein ACWGJ9_08325 [Curtobacterium citreum]
MRELRVAAAAAVVTALAVTLSGCGKSSTPTIYSHGEAVAADDEMFAVLNDTIDATGGLSAWRAWSSNDPLDHRVGTVKQIGGGECMPTNAFGMAGDPLGTYDGALLNSAGTLDGAATAETVKGIWRDAGYTDITTKRGEGGTTVRGKHDDPSPVLTFTYGGQSGKQKASLEGDSICQSYDYLDDDTLDDNRYDGDE